MPTTIKELMDAVNLTERFSFRPNKSQATGATTAREDHLLPPLTLVSYSSEWLDEKLTAFLGEHGQTAASTDTIEQTRYFLLNEKVNVTKYKNQWKNKTEFAAAFRPLLFFVTSCVEDIIQDNTNPIMLHQKEGSWAKPDFTCCTRDGFVLHHLLLEMETTSVLTDDIIKCIHEEAGPGGEWSHGNFRPREPVSGSEEPSILVHRKAATMIQQAYLKMIPRTAIDTSSISSASTAQSLGVVSPLYTCLSNYNGTFIMRRLPKLDTGSIDIAGPYSPQQVIPFLITILLEQVKANSSPDLRTITEPVFKGLNLADEDNSDDEDEKHNANKRRKDVNLGHEDKGHNDGAGSTSCRGMETSIWDAGLRLSVITHDYDIRGFNDIKYIFSDERMMLTSWAGHLDGTVSAPNSVYPRSSAIPHITIVARLDASIAGETFLAKCDGAPLLVWKEIPLDEDHEEYAKTEVSMYNGPLASLQGTVVPTLYGVFYDQKYKCVVLLMEYVGKAIGSDWEDISPAQRLQSDDLHHRLRAVGVEHGEWKPKNICMLHGRMRVIDFSDARLRGR